ATDAVQIDSDLAVGDFVQLGRKFRSFNDDTLQTLTLDVSDDNVNGSSILRLQDTAANERRIGIFRGQGGAGADQAPTISVVVHNGTGTDGQAGEAADGLDRLGFDTSPGTGDAENSDFGHSVVRYSSADDEAEARFAAAQIDGGSDVEQVDSIVGGADVEVVTGADFEGISSDLQPPPQALGGGGGGGGAGGGTTPVGQVPSVDPPARAAC
ncbi:MAG TPA: LytR C-terminal domain-containing protein, partial [Acidimicrobiales bacterium]